MRGGLCDTEKPIQSTTPKKLESLVRVGQDRKRREEEQAALSSASSDVGPRTTSSDLFVFKGFFFC